MPGRYRQCPQFEGRLLIKNDQARNPKFTQTKKQTRHRACHAQQRFMQFVDPNAGKPIFDEDMVNYNNLEAIIPITMNEIFQKATNAEYIRIDPGSITSETNYLKGTFKYRISPFLTDTSDWYIVVRHPYYRPFLYRTPKDVETVIADINNSDHAREVNENIIYTHIRNAIGVWFPGVIIKVNNQILIGRTPITSPRGARPNFP